ncbi:MAG: hypothetical protein S4CHLAM123_11310 [Chlamydiales bacterium]|nr:hypothetical protein [Chlamydiales bacterium]
MFNKIPPQTDQWISNHFTKFTSEDDLTVAAALAVQIFGEQAVMYYKNENKPSSLSLVQRFKKNKKTPDQEFLTYFVSQFLRCKEIRENSFDQNSTLADFIAMNENKALRTWAEKIKIPTEEESKTLCYQEITLANQTRPLPYQEIGEKELEDQQINATHFLFSNSEIKKYQLEAVRQLSLCRLLNLHTALIEEGASITWGQIVTDWGQCESHKKRVQNWNDALPKSFMIWTANPAEEQYAAQFDLFQEYVIDRTIRGFKTLYPIILITYENDFKHILKDERVRLDLLYLLHTKGALENYIIPGDRSSDLLVFLFQCFNQGSKTRNGEEYPLLKDMLSQNADWKKRRIQRYLQTPTSNDYQEFHDTLSQIHIFDPLLKPLLFACYRNPDFSINFWYTFLKRRARKYTQEVTFFILVSSVNHSEEKRKEFQDTLNSISDFAEKLHPNLFFLLYNEALDAAYLFTFLQKCVLFQNKKFDSFIAYEFLMRDYRQLNRDLIEKQISEESIDQLFLTFANNDTVLEALKLTTLLFDEMLRKTSTITPQMLFNSLQSENEALSEQKSHAVHFLLLHKAWMGNQEPFCWLQLVVDWSQGEQQSATSLLNSLHPTLVGLKWNNDEKSHAKTFPSFQDYVIDRTLRSCSFNLDKILQNELTKLLTTERTRFDCLKILFLENSLQQNRAKSCTNAHIVDFLQDYKARVNNILLFSFLMCKSDTDNFELIEKKLNALRPTTNKNAIYNLFFALAEDARSLEELKTITLLIAQLCETTSSFEPVVTTELLFQCLEPKHKAVMSHEQHFYLLLLLVSKPALYIDGQELSWLQLLIDWKPLDSSFLDKLHPKLREQEPSQYTFTNPNFREQIIELTLSPFKTTYGAKLNPFIEPIQEHLHDEKTRLQLLKLNAEQTDFPVFLLHCIKIKGTIANLYAEFFLSQEQTQQQRITHYLMDPKDIEPDFSSEIEKISSFDALQKPFLYAYFYRTNLQIDNAFESLVACVKNIGQKYEKCQAFEILISYYSQLDKISNFSKQQTSNILHLLRDEKRHTNYWISFLTRCVEIQKEKIDPEPAHTFLTVQSPPGDIGQLNRVLEEIATAQNPQLQLEKSMHLLNLLTETKHLSNQDKIAANPATAASVIEYLTKKIGAIDLDSDQN